MATIPVKVSTRINTGIKKFQKIIAAAKAKDLNESDTVTIITDILCEVLGYDKYSEITSEYAIKKTFCDLAIKLDDKPVLLIECKAIGLKLKSDHIQQAINYGSQEGIEWVVLTNGEQWQIYKITFAKPVEKELVYEFNFTDINLKNTEHIDMIFCLAKESLSRSKSALNDLYTQKGTLNKFMIGQLLLEESTAIHIKKMLKKIAPEVKITEDGIRNIIENEVIKREVLDPEETKEYIKIIKKKLLIKEIKQKPE